MSKDRFSGIVDQYDLWTAIDPDYDRIHTRFREALAQELGRIPGEAVTVLEVGCGTGYTSRIILEADSRVRLETIDRSVGMVARAGAELSGFGERFGIHFGDMREILPGLGTFPIICSALTIHNLCPDEQREVYSLVFQRLSPGGLFLSGDKVSLNDDDAYRETLAIIIRRIEAVRGAHPQECAFFLNHEREDDAIRVTESAVLDMLEQAGFEQVSIGNRAGMHAIINARKGVAK
ncbi:MAG: class I SAM-dependent methyltransferase [Candidatus Moraniibacteriota bacterium]|nr:MAG: class I SAM-dependent methyltransferase [Candidatus Moranbacteria bacterium]